MTNNVLSLEDPRWKDLDHRNSKGAIYIRDELVYLLDTPSDLERFGDLWPELCSEGTTWAAAYAAVPYVVEIAKRLPPVQRADHLYFVGLTVICQCPNEGKSFEIRSYLEPSYRDALQTTLPLLAETLLLEHDAAMTRYLLAAAAALKGYTALGELINHIDAGCPHCGEELLEE